MTKSDNEKDNVDWKDLRFLYFITNVHIHAYDGGGNLEAIKDADEVEILESLLVDPAPVNTAYGDLVLIHLSARTSTISLLLAKNNSGFRGYSNLYKVNGSIEIVSFSIFWIYRNCKTIGVNRSHPHFYGYCPPPKGNFLDTY